MKWVNGRSNYEHHRSKEAAYFIRNVVLATPGRFAEIIFRWWAKGISDFACSTLFDNSSYFCAIMDYRALMFLKLLLFVLMDPFEIVLWM